MSTTDLTALEKTILKDVTQEELSKYKAHVATVTDETARLAFAKETATYSKAANVDSKRKMRYSLISAFVGFVAVPLTIITSILVLIGVVTFITTANLFYVAIIWLFITNFCAHKITKIDSTLKEAIWNKPSYLE